MAKVAQLAMSLCAVMAAFTPKLPGQPTAVKVRHCAAADSALGQKSGAWKGGVKAVVDSARGQFLVMGGQPGKALTLTGSAQVDGRTWSGVPPLEITVILRGRDVEALVGLGRDPKVTVFVDDSITLTTTGVKLGSFAAPANYPRQLLMLPVSTLVLPADFLTLARARKARVMVEQGRVDATAAELRNIAALYAVLACGTID